jgi:glycosyltransferase involved in cell wall biosynthesis
VTTFAEVHFVATSNDFSAFGFHDGHACGMYRVLMPFDQMAAAGLNVATHCGWTEDARRYRVIVGQRISRTHALPIWRRLRQNHRLVYETDDDLWSIDPTNFAASLAHGADAIDAAEQAIAAAHMVTASTEALAEVLRQLHDNVVVLPNHIPAGLLGVERPRRGRVTVGWAGGDSHLRDIAMVAPILRRFFARNPAVDFHTIGTDFRSGMALPGRHTDWEPDIWAYYRRIDFDVGLAPLVDSVFNRSKSDIKAKEYAALGIPVIASYSEPYHEFVVDGETGFLIRREHEWAKRLRELTHDVAMRDEMGAKAKAHAARWTIEDGYQRWVDAYRSLC